MKKYGESMSRNWQAVLACVSPYFCGIGIRVSRCSYSCQLNWKLLAEE